jgi:hypothetical protein
LIRSICFENLKRAPPDIAEALGFAIMKGIIGVCGLLHSSRFAIRVNISSDITEPALIISVRENVHRTSLEGGLSEVSPQTAMSLHTNQTLSLERRLMRSCLRGYVKYGGF